MASVVLKRVVIDNYKIFSNRQEVDFTVDPVVSTNSKYFTLVGENGCGKSTFLALIGLASDFGGKVTTRVCDSARESIVVCEYEVTNWSQLACIEENDIVNIYPALNLWFLTGVLQIPEKVKEFLTEKNPELASNVLTLVIGFKHKCDCTKDGGAVEKFLYIKCDSKIVCLIQPLNTKAKMTTVDAIEVKDLLAWSPQETQLVPTHCNFLRCTAGVLVNAPSFYKPHNAQAAVILALRNTLLPIENRDGIWEGVIEMFHQLTGDTNITVFYDIDSDCIHMKQKFGATISLRDYLSEGFFHAFIIAFLLVSPLVKTILIDEPTAGMHPLQIRRLQQILSKKSAEKNKVIIITTHAPDMVQTSRINRIFRFQRLYSGFTEVRRASPVHNFREMRFISSLEGRELFFTRRIIWVEGDTDRRFCDAMLKLIDERDEVLWEVLMDPRDNVESHGVCREPPCEAMVLDFDEEGSSDMDEIDYGSTDINPLDSLFSMSDYERAYFRAHELAHCRERARSCSVLSLSGKKNIDKATKICSDLGIPYAVICDLDAVLPNSKRHSIMKQFLHCVGDWSVSRIDRKLILDGEQSPASACVVEPKHRNELKACRYAQEVMDFYENRERIFAWRVGNGEIEDLVRVTKPKFAKKWWADYTFEAFQDLIKEMLIPSDSSRPKQSNPELLRAFYFVLSFLCDFNGN